MNKSLGRRRQRGRRDVGGAGTCLVIMGPSRPCSFFGLPGLLFCNWDKGGQIYYLCFCLIPSALSQASLMLCRMALSYWSSAWSLLICSCNSTSLVDGSGGGGAASADLDKNLYISFSFCWYFSKRISFIFFLKLLKVVCVFCYFFGRFFYALVQHWPGFLLCQLIPSKG